MSWASNYIEQLKLGNTVEFRPRGKSMTGIINDGQLVRVVPVEENTILGNGDVVLVKVKKNVYLHLIGAVQHNRYRIENASGFVNGWTGKKNVYGIVVWKE